jgi:biopolymer transport protein TolR
MHRVDDPMQTPSANREPFEAGACPILSDTAAPERSNPMAFSTSGNDASGGHSNALINVTPLIDVLLVLIIVSMVVQSMSKQRGLEAQIPQRAQGSHLPDVQRTIVIRVVGGAKDQSPMLTINRGSVSWEDLHRQLQDIFKQREERVAFVRGDDDIDFRYVAEVIDIARSAGVDKVGLLTTDFAESGLSGKL